MTERCDLASAALQQIRESIIARAPIPGAALAELLDLTISSDESVARAGLRALFPGLIEWLNDSFAPAAADYYNEIFSQVIETCRRRPEGAALDRLLDRFALPDREALRQRFDRLGKVLEPELLDPARLRRLIVLSRVTIGADVAVTSVLIDGVRRNLPDPRQLEVVIIGPAKLGELYGGDPQLRIREVVYQRGGTLLDRLLSWREVVAAVESEVSGFAPDEYLVIDPDSRLTQLGLLPVLAPPDEARRYRFFPSRVFTAPGCSSLGQLAAAWAAGRRGPDGDARSFVALPERFRLLGRMINDRLRGVGASRVVTVSLGVGGNEEKRRGEKFEIELLRRLGEDSWVILDQGFTEAEERQVERAIAPWRGAGRPIIALNERNFADFTPSVESPRGILTWQGGIGSLAGLIAASDQYVGYDSSGQHIAAALDIPGLTYFNSTNPTIFAQRWAPFSNQSRVDRA